MMFWLYVAVLGLFVAVGLLPSDVTTTYSWFGAVLMIVGLVALGKGSNVARWLLVALGVLVALATIAVQSELDAVATADACLALLSSFLLLTPSLRAYTSSP